MSSPEKNITSVLKETRQFPPSAEFVAQANVNAAERDRLPLVQAVDAGSRLE